jgi:hypothetical protein
MGTRSRIGVMHGDVVKSVYCHWDGYLEHNGQILMEHYDSAKVNHLVALGDISSLGPAIGEKHPFSPHGSPEDSVAYDAAKKAGWCTFYGRDRGETGTEWQVAHNFEQFYDQCDGCGAEYYYIMKDGVWYVGTTYSTGALAGKLVPLAQALTQEAVPA